MGKVQVISFIILVSMLSIVSALTTFKQGDEVQLCHAVRSGGALPPASTSCNITVAYSNGSTLVDYLAMDDVNDRFCYNLTTTDTNIKGLYPYEITCSDGNNNATFTSQYLVNLGGVEPTQERTDTTTRTIYIFLGLAVLFFISLFFVKTMPIKATIFLLMFWFILMGVNASYISLQDEVVNTSLEGFFSFFLTVSFWANYAIMISIIVIWMITFIVTMMDRHSRSLIKNYG